MSIEKINLEILESPERSLIDFLDKKIDEYNFLHWDIKVKTPLAVKLTEGEKIIAGACGRTFGSWFLLDLLWVDEAYRGQNLGTKILQAIEQAALRRGCKWALLDTLEFQARPFYERQGWQLQWEQKNYPTHGSKFFMTKELT